MIKAIRTNENNSVCKEIKVYFGLRKGMRYGDAVSPKGNQPWIFIEKTDAEAEAPIFRLPDAKSWLAGKDPDAGKYWRQEEKGTTEDEMVGWHHRFNGHEFEQTLGDGEGQGSLELQSMRLQRVRHDWVNEQQMEMQFYRGNDSDFCPSADYF